MKAILLFDIDGTLVRTGGAGKAAVEDALRETFGVREIVDNVPYSGRTDRAILSDVLSVHGVEPTEANLERFASEYLSRLPDRLGRLRGEVCPGVAELLPRLAAVPHVRLGLLTGNVKVGASHKLRHFGLWEHFPFGGFGDGEVCRNAVARAALTAAGAHLGDVSGASVWVIGDTPHDVACGRAIGARTLAVATGWTPLAELHATGADLVLGDLADAGRLPGEWFE